MSSSSKSSPSLVPSASQDSVTIERVSLNSSKQSINEIIFGDRDLALVTINKHLL